MVGVAAAPTPEWNRSARQKATFAADFECPDENEPASTASVKTLDTEKASAPKGSGRSATLSLSTSSALPPGAIRVLDPPSAPPAMANDLATAVGAPSTSPAATTPEDRRWTRRDLGIV